MKIIIFKYDCMPIQPLVIGMNCKSWVIKDENF